jgi:hypothetical protein
MVRTKGTNRMTNEGHTAETPPGTSPDDPASSVQIGSLLSAACSANAERRVAAEPAGSPPTPAPSMPAEHPQICGLSAPCVPNPACIESIDFAYGLMDLLVVFYSNLIARRLIDPEALRVDCSRFAALWRNKGRGSRAVAAEVFIERVNMMTAAARQSDSGIVNSTLTKTVN